MKLELNDQLNVHLNQLKLNKQNSKLIKDEIRSESMKLFHFLMRQQIKLIKQTDSIERELEINLIDLISKKNNLLNKSEFNLIEYNEIVNNNLNKVNFNYKFKTNEILERDLIIGHLLVFIYFFNYWSGNQFVRQRQLTSFGVVRLFSFETQINVRKRKKTLKKH